MDLSKIRLALKEELPGHLAHSVIMPHRKKVESINEIDFAKKSAVLLLMYPIHKTLNIVFIVRSTYKGVHSAQISFPGGKFEQSDSSLKNTALREANEELGINTSQVEILGKLTWLYVPPSNFVIHPFVGIAKSRPNFIPDPREVNSYLEIEIDDFLKNDRLINSKVLLQGKSTNVKGFHLKENLLWGATAMIFNEFIEVLRKL